MFTQRKLSFLIITTLLLVLAAATSHNRPATSASQPANSSGNDKVAGAEQIKDLRKQLAELQAQVNDLKKTPRIVAAGMAIFKLGAKQNNRTSVRVKLDADLVAKLGEDYVVLLTTRYPTGGYPFFVPFWKLADDGFDITLVDPTISGTASYPNQDRPYPVDWIVVKK